MDNEIMFDLKKVKKSNKFGFHLRPEGAVAVFYKNDSDTKPQLKVDFLELANFVGSILEQIEVYQENGVTRARPKGLA